MVISKFEEEVDGRKVKVEVIAPVGSYELSKVGKTKNQKIKVKYKHKKPDAYMHPWDLCNWNETALYC